MNLFKLANEYETIANETPLIKSINEYLKLAQDYSGNYTTANDHWVFKSQDSKTKSLFGDTDKGKHVSIPNIIGEYFQDQYKTSKFVGKAENGNLIYEWTDSKYYNVRFYVSSEEQMSEKQKQTIIADPMQGALQIKKAALKPLHDYNKDLKIGKWYTFEADDFFNLIYKYKDLGQMFENLYDEHHIESKEEPKSKEIQQPNNNLNAKLSKELISLRNGFYKNVDNLISLMKNKISLSDLKIINRQYDEISAFINTLISSCDADDPIDETINYSKRHLTNLEHEVNMYFSNKSSKNYDILKIFGDAFKDFLQIIRKTLEMASYGEEYMMENEFYTLKKE